ncbi:homoserine O-succinyltransferase [Pseudofrancisella aestuarii]|uniref:Homoserine O-acetyltransferase n=1 Tax=Pseudofrancisella aestuarii TaxID=2670347 RepID=A0ABV9TCW4_9GAMM|nr:homoserine O-succinyltransferase [Pseudofrancisella aestuarii]
MSVNVKESFEWLKNLKIHFPTQINYKNSNNIRHLRIAIVNLMPTVKETEKQWTEVLSHNSNTIVDLVFFHSLTRPSTRVDKAHLEQNYQNWQDYDFNDLDGIIITGAPVELLEFKDVDYYKEVCDIIAKSINHDLSLMLVCWAAQAGLNYLYGIEKICLDKKLFGVYEHKLLKPNHPLLKGFSGEQLKACISRQTKIDSAEVLKYTYPILASSIDGLDCLSDKNSNITYMFNHLEYIENTLEAEYLRDLEASKDIDKPYNYYDQQNSINYSWKDDRKIFYSNWLDILKEKR